MEKSKKLNLYERIAACFCLLRRGIDPFEIPKTPISILESFDREVSLEEVILDLTWQGEFDILKLPFRLRISDEEFYVESFRAARERLSGEEQAARFSKLCAAMAWDISQLPDTYTYKTFLQDQLAWYEKLYLPHEKTNPEKR